MITKFLSHEIPNVNAINARITIHADASIEIPYAAPKMQQRCSNA